MRYCGAVAVLGLALLLVLTPAVAAQKNPRKKKTQTAAEQYAAGENTVKLVDYFLKSKTSALQADLIPTFLSILPATLPRRQRDGYRAKRAELRQLKKIVENKKKPPIRRVGLKPKEFCDKEDATLFLVAYYRKLGFEQISEDEELWLESKTKCSFCELMDEFSLTALVVPPKKKKDPATQFLFLHAKDPLMALVGQYREGKSATGTNFFSVGFFGACH